MKKIKNFVVLFIVLAVAMSMLVACRPADEDDGDISGGTTATTNTDGNNGTVNGNGDGTTVNNGDGSTDGTGTSGTGAGTGTTGNGNGTGTGTTGNGTGTGAGTNGNGSGTGTSGNSGTQQSTYSSGDVHAESISENPLLKKGKTYNREAACSYNVDSSNFVKNAKLSDLKGKTFTLYTGVDYGMFSYYNKNEKLTSEWSWFKELKSLYGCTIKYIRCTPGGSNVVKPFQAMSAGKDIDLITTHVASFPYICNILEPLDGYVNMANFSKSPGLDPQITSLTKWKGKYIILGPGAQFGCFNYNKTFIKNAGLEDPYTLFKAGKWNWTTFKKYMTGLPKTTSTGKKVYGCSTWTQYWYWANTNATPCFEIDGSNPNGGIKNNFDTAAVKETYIYLESVMDAGGQYYSGNGGEFFWNTKPNAYCCMYYSRPGVNVRGILEEENKKNEYFWVPFPKNEKNSKAINHVEIYGFGIGIPRKTNKPANRSAAVKFCELWCNRYTESCFDGLMYKSKWTYEQAMECYEYGQIYGRFGLGSGVGKLASYAGNTTTNFNKSITDASFSTASCMEKLSNYAKQEVANVLKFGIQ